jgi:hypothetical protein
VKRRWLVWVVLALGGCESKSAPSAGPATRSATAATAMTAAASTSSRAAAISASAEPAGSAPEPVVERKPSGLALVERAKIARLSVDGDGRLVAELDRDPPARAWLTLATKKDPLAPRSAAAYFRIAERIAPGLTAPTALRAVAVGDLARPADEATKKRLEKTARVLANGTIEVALTLAPAPNLTKVDLTDVSEGKPAWKWETQLAAREAPPESERATLASYQALLASDYVAANGARRFVHFSPRSGRMTVADGNEAFSARLEDDSLRDALGRLSRHMVFSRGLAERLGKLERSDLEAALRWGDPPSLLVTPKQVEETIERARRVERVMNERKQRRGEAAAMILP